MNTSPTGERAVFPATDGTELHYKAWIPDGGFSRLMILLHRGHEHADRWDGIVPQLAMPGMAIFAWEARGHGRSPGERGHAPGFMTYVRDLEAFSRFLSARHGVPIEHTAVVAHSVGAVIAAAWAHDFGPPLAALVLITPAFEVRLYVPGALAGCRLMARLNPRSVIKSYVKGSWLTRDPIQQAAYDADPLISKNISARILVDLFDTSRRVIEDAGVMRMPLLLLSAGADKVVSTAPHDRFFARSGAVVKERHTFQEARHALFHDVCAAEVAQRVRDFVATQWDRARPDDLARGDEVGATFDEYRALQRPRSILSVKGLNFAMQRGSMRTLGRLSKGIRVGLRTGFDSGESLDYVYDNQPRGAWGIGKLIDKGYLDAIGWRGIRQRRELLRAALDEALRSIRSEGLPWQVTDIAAGAGRYLLDLLQREPDLRVVCRDRSQGALALGRSNAMALGLADRIRHEQGDAFSREELGHLREQPGVAVVSGLYELFPKNGPVRESLSGMHTALPEGGWLLYTNQPWHPQVEMIARTLTNRDGEAWIMRRRSQAEMDALVAEAGFTKIRQWIDDYGIFTVSAARKLRGA